MSTLRYFTDVVDSLSQLCNFAEKNGNLIGLLMTDFEAIETYCLSYIFVLKGDLMITLLTVMEKNPHSFLGPLKKLIINCC